MELLSVSAAAVVFGTILVSALLYTIVPGPQLAGYVTDVNNKALVYRVNGLRVFILCLGIWAALVYTGILPADFFVTEFWPVVVAANIFGLSATLLAVLHGRHNYPDTFNQRRRACTIDQVKRQQDNKADPWRDPGLAAELYAGAVFNPRMFGGRLDLKMFLYLIGALLLELTVLSGAARLHATAGHVSAAMLCYVWMMSWFLFEYIYHEHVHIYTYDLFAEKLGFKLIWGCLVFYPFFYPIGVWPLTETHNDISGATCALILALFYFGWSLTRGANNQKYYFKINPSTPFLGIKPATVGDTRILCSGFWGAARHINYLGEIVQAVAISLPAFLATGSLVPFAYPAYYVALLFPRQLEDDKLCAHKYGAVWDDYVARVPYRIIPYIY